MPINLSAGQTSMSPSCLRGLAAQMETPIYYPSYWELEEETAGMMQQLLGTAADILFVAGSATFGEEAAFRSILDPGDRVVVINAGVFGQVAADLLRAIGCHPVEVKVPAGTPVDLAEVERALDLPGIKALVAVHMETSTGTVYPVGTLASLVRKRDLLFFVDAISSGGGLEFRMDEWGVDVVITSPQKCLCGPQGIAIVAVNERAWSAAARKKEVNNSLCLDLNVWKRYREEKVKAMLSSWRHGKREPVIRGRARHEPTPSGPLMRGLHGALIDYFEEGAGHVRRRSAVSAKAVREAVRFLGLRLVVHSEEIASPLVTAFYLPGGIYEKDFRERMLYRWGVAIGNGEIGDDNVRIGTMGLSAQPKYVLPAVAAMEDVLESFDYPVQNGAAVAVSQKVYEAAKDIDWQGI